MGAPVPSWAPCVHSPWRGGNQPFPPNHTCRFGKERSNDAVLSLRASAVSKGLNESEAKVDGSWRKGKPQRTGTAGYAALWPAGTEAENVRMPRASSDSRREHQQALLQLCIRRRREGFVSYL